MYSYRKKNWNTQSSIANNAMAISAGETLSRGRSRRATEAVSNLRLSSIRFSGAQVAV
jgi:hypothetical protein